MIKNGKYIQNEKQRKRKGERSMKKEDKIMECGNLNPKRPYTLRIRHCRNESRALSKLFRQLGSVIVENVG